MVGVGATQESSDAFTRVLLAASRDWIAKKRARTEADGVGSPIGFECRLYDGSGESIASLELRPHPIGVAAYVAGALARSFEAEIVVVCAEGLVYDHRTDDVAQRFAAGDRRIDEALVVTVGERTPRRVSSVQFPFVYEGRAIRIGSLRAGDRSPSLRMGGDDPDDLDVDEVAGPIASALSLGFATPCVDHGSRLDAVLDSLTLALDWTEGDAVRFRPTIRPGSGAAATAADRLLIDAITVMLDKDDR